MATVGHSRQASDLDLQEITVDDQQETVSNAQDHIELPFENSEEFYRAFDELLNSNGRFSVRLPKWDSSRYFPVRLMEILQSFSDTQYGKLWEQAYESLDLPDTDENIKKRTWKQKFSKHFENPVTEKWGDYEDAVCQTRDESPGASLMWPVPLPMYGLPTETFLRFAGWMWYAPQYCWKWGRAQDRKRWGYITALTAAGVGSGAAAGAMIGAAVGGTTGCTIGVVSSGNRVAEVTVTKEGALIMFS